MIDSCETRYFISLLNTPLSPPQIANSLMCDSASVTAKIDTYKCWDTAFSTSCITYTSMWSGKKSVLFPLNLICCSLKSHLILTASFRMGRPNQIDVIKNGVCVHFIGSQNHLKRICLLQKKKIV